MNRTAELPSGTVSGIDHLGTGESSEFWKNLSGMKQDDWVTDTEVLNHFGRSGWECFQVSEKQGAFADGIPWQEVSYYLRSRTNNQ